jgi:hypothetical protein
MLSKSIFLLLKRLYITTFYEKQKWEYDLITFAGLNETLIECQRPMCWETYVGQQFYKLTTFDLLTQAGASN